MAGQGRPTGGGLDRPAIPGLAAHGFDVDTHEAAMRLDAHLAALGKEPASPARSTVAVVGAGFTGIEVAAEMSAKLAGAGNAGRPRGSLTPESSSSTVFVSLVPS